MRSNAWTIFRLNAATRGNKLIYWLGRLPLLRRVFTDRLYAAGEGKLALFLLQNLWWVLKAIAGKVIYLAVLLLIAAFVALDGVQDTLTAANLGPFCWLFLWMSFFIGALIVPHAVAPSQLKYICVRMMAMDAWRYQMITGLGHHLAAFAGFTPLLMILTALLGAGPWAGLVIGVELAFVRLAAEGLHLAIYSRTGASVGGKVWYILLMAIAGTAGSAACLLALPQSRPQDALLHPAVFAALAVLGILGAAYMVRFPHYYRLVLDTCKAEAVSPELAKEKAKGSQFRDVQLKDSDLTAEGDSRLTGWPYLQALFFRRHRRMLYKPVKIVLAILAGVTVVGAVALLRGEETAATFDLVPPGGRGAEELPAALHPAGRHHAGPVRGGVRHVHGAHPVRRGAAPRGGVSHLPGRHFVPGGVLRRPLPGHVLPVPALHLRSAGEEPLLLRHQPGGVHRVLRLHPDQEHPLLVRPAGAGGDGGVLRRHPHLSVPPLPPDLPGEMKEALP